MIPEDQQFDGIERDDEPLLAPEPDDPLEALREEWRDVDRSVAALKREANEQAEQDAGR